MYVYIYSFICIYIYIPSYVCICIYAYIHIREINLTDKKKTYIGHANFPSSINLHIDFLPQATKGHLLRELLALDRFDVANKILARLPASPLRQREDIADVLPR